LRDIFGLIGFEFHQMIIFRKEVVGINLVFLPPLVAVASGPRPSSQNDFFNYPSCSNLSPRSSVLFKPVEP
jgi:hypothetical protein